MLFNFDGFKEMVLIGRSFNLPVICFAWLFAFECTVVSDIVSIHCFFFATVAIGGMILLFLSGGL